MIFFKNLPCVKLAQHNKKDGIGRTAPPFSAYPPPGPTSHLVDDAIVLLQKFGEGHKDEIWHCG